MKMRLKGKVAIVTGAGSGIGRETAKLFAAEGAMVTIFDKDFGAGRETESIVREGGGEAMAIQGNVADARDVEGMTKETVRKFGRLDVLVNNAGAILVRDVVDTSTEDWDRIVSINLKGVFFCSKFAVEQMIRQGNGGSIVNIGSTLGVIGRAGCTAYCAAKGGVVNFTRALALECVKHGIRVNCVCPAAVETDMFLGTLRTVAEQIGYEEAKESFLPPIGRFGRPLDIALAALYLTSDEAGYVTGTVLMCDGGKTCH